MTALIRHQRGQDLRLPCQWRYWNEALPTPAWSPVNITGMTFEVFEISVPTMLTGWTVPIIDAVNGKFEVWRDWDATWPGGTGRLLRFRVRRTDFDKAFGLFDLDLC